MTATDSRRFRGRWRRARTAKEVEQVMTLTAHLAELRKRLVISILAIIAGGVVGIIYYQPLIELLQEPYDKAADQLDLDALVTLPGISAPFTFQLIIGLTVGVIIASPVWLLQIW